MKNSIYAKIPIVFLATTASSLAVFPFEFTSYTGNGTEAASIVSGDLGTSVTAVDDLTSGTVTLDILDQARLNGVSIDADFSIEAIGGTADLVFNNRNNFDGGANTFDGVLVNDLAGVTSLEINLVYSDFIGARSGGNNNNLLTSRPALAGLSVFTSGTGLVLNNFNVQIDIGDTLYSATGTPGFANGNFVTGLGGGAAVASADFGTTVADQTTLIADGLSSVSEGDFLVVRAFDDDGDGTTTNSEDFDQVLIRNVTFTLTPTNGATEFSADTQFLFSLDGERDAGVPVNIPEPTSTLLLAAGLGLFSFRRARS